MNFRFQEFISLYYRIFLVYICYTICRILFVYFNNDIVQLESFSELFSLCYHGIRFDNVAIVYSNLLFILMSIIPWRITTSGVYQKILFWIFLIFNSFFLSFNFIDFAYYRFNNNRLMSNFLEVIEFETNKATLFFHFVEVYYYLFILFFAVIFLLGWAYKKVKVYPMIIDNYIHYSLSSVIFFLGTIALFVLAARGGDFKKSTRPITVIDAMNDVKSPQHSDVVLNSTFTIIKTLGMNKVKKSNQFSQEEINEVLNPLKNYPVTKRFNKKPNVIIFILESMGREYWGSMNASYNIPGFKSYTPFLDSLAQHSLIFPNHFATSRKTIHGMPSILAGIPSFETSYSSSLYSRQNVESIVSVAEALDYNTSFFHGAANGSMGLSGFANTLGYDEYYGRTEFDNDEEFDGFWGIWDEPFFQYTKSILDKKKTPFLSTIFTISSHEPYIIPKKYEGKFDKGNLPMHQCVGYTDYSIRKFFESCRNSTWFEDTIFIFTADHGNQTFYPFYEKMVNRFANPLMIYKLNSDLVGVDNQLASHMDIFPTVADLIDYPKPFRSWGRSLISDKKNDPFVINYFSGGSYFIMDENYICVHNGYEAIGFYELDDKNFENNIISQKNQLMVHLEKKCSLFLENYFNTLMAPKK